MLSVPFFGHSNQHVVSSHCSLVYMPLVTLGVGHLFVFLQVFIVLLDEVSSEVFGSVLVWHFLKIVEY